MSAATCSGWRRAAGRRASAARPPASPARPGRRGRQGSRRIRPQGYSGRAPVAASGAPARWRRWRSRCAWRCHAGRAARLPGRPAGGCTARRRACGLARQRTAAARARDWTAGARQMGQRSNAWKVGVPDRRHPAGSGASGRLMAHLQRRGLALDPQPVARDAPPRAPGFPGPAGDGRTPRHKCSSLRGLPPHGRGDHRAHGGSTTREPRPLSCSTPPSRDGPTYARRASAHCTLGWSASGAGTRHRGARGGSVAATRARPASARRSAR